MIYNILQPEVLCDAQNAQNSFFAGGPLRTPLGSSRRSPRPPSRLKRGIHDPHSPPLDACGASVSAPMANRLELWGKLAPRTYGG